MNLMIERAGISAGPFTADEVRAFLADGELEADALAWTEGFVDWTPVQEVLARLPSEPANAPVFTDLALRDELPPEVRGFCWGAFFMTPFWSIGNRVWVGLWSLLPGLGILVSLWLGFKGRELTWRHGHWRSLPHFITVQRRWSIAGIVGLVLMVLLGFVVLAALLERGELPEQPQAEAPATAPTHREAVPVARRAPAEPTTQPAPVQPEAGETPVQARPARLARPVDRDVLRERLQGASIAEVQAALGEPNYQRTDRGVLAYVYLDLSRNPATGQTDKIAIVLFVNERVHEIHFRETAQ